jgi:hypothetical protein
VWQAHFGHGAMSDLSPLSDQERTSQHFLLALVDAFTRMMIQLVLFLIAIAVYAVRIAAVLRNVGQ